MEFLMGLDFHALQVSQLITLAFVVVVSIGLVVTSRLIGARIARLEKRQQERLDREGVDNERQCTTLCVERHYPGRGSR